MESNRWYVVWKGRKTGIFDNWEQCDESVRGFSEALYKSFPDFEDALVAFYMGHKAYVEQEKRNHEQGCENLTQPTA